MHTLASPGIPPRLLLCLFLLFFDSSSTLAGSRLKALWEKIPKPEQSRDPKEEAYSVVSNRQGFLRAPDPETPGLSHLGELFRKEIRPFFRNGGRGILLQIHGANHSRKKGEKLADAYRRTHLERGIYPLSILWQTEIQGSLGRALRTKSEADSAPRGRRLDRWAARLGAGRYWSSLKERARETLLPGRIGDLLRQELTSLQREFPKARVHLTATSAGTVMATEILASYTQDQGKGRPALRLGLLQLKAGAQLLEEFGAVAEDAFRRRKLERVLFWVLKPSFEDQDRVAHVIPGSILQLVSRSLETSRDAPLVGLARSLSKDPRIQDWVRSGRAQVLESPNELPRGDPRASRAKTHVEFERDPILFTSESLWLEAHPRFPSNP